MSHEGLPRHLNRLKMAAIIQSILIIEVQIYLQALLKRPYFWKSVVASTPIDEKRGHQSSAKGHAENYRGILIFFFGSIQEAWSYEKHICSISSRVWNKCRKYVNITPDVKKTFCTIRTSMLEEPTLGLISTNGVTRSL